MTTRFRLYQLNDIGGSYSYYDGHNFTLIEARYNDTNKKSIKHEMKQCGVSKIDTLHITSWDTDHCNFDELAELIKTLKPRIVEVPSYEPHSTMSIKSQTLLSVLDEVSFDLKEIGPEFFKTLYVASRSYSCRQKAGNVLVWPTSIDLDPKKANDNSIVQLFRSGSIGMLSTGDVESKAPRDAIMYSPILKNEIDVLILPHHGSIHAVTDFNLLQHLKPTVAVCTSNFKNKFEHPYPQVRSWCSQLEIPLHTTKMGDIIIESTNGTSMTVYDYSYNQLLKKSTARTINSHWLKRKP